MSDDTYTWWWERLHYRLFGYWPWPVVDRRMAEYHRREVAKAQAILDARFGVPGV